MEKMVKLPVRFPNAIKVSEELKDFIKRCLEVDENKRIGVDGIKNFPLVNKLLKERSDEELVPLTTANSTSNRDEPKMSLRPSDLNKLPRTEVSKPLTGISNKENIPNMLAKATIDRNNTILIHHINTFRLLYKIHEQLKLNKPD